jgi:TIR domain
MPPNEVFLSHSNLDQPFVTSLAEVLRRHGVPVWHSRTDIVGAQQWIDEIGAAFNRCDWFLVVLSPNSVESMWVKRELSYALSDNRYENTIVPILYQPCDPVQLSWALRIFQMVDFTPDFDEGYRNLLRVWGLGYRK